MMQTAVKTKKPRKQAVSDRFWAMRTYRGRIVRAGRKGPHPSRAERANSSRFKKANISRLKRATSCDVSVE